MPAYSRGKLRETLTYIVLYNSPANIYYAFKTKDLAALANITQGDLTTQLGHIYTVANNSLVVIRATSPKPPRVTKVINRNPDATQQRSVSSFCATANLNIAQQNGWNVTELGARTGLRNDNRTVTAVAQLSNELYYCAPMNAADWATYNQQLGLIDPTSLTTNVELNKLVAASSRPKAGKAFKTLGQNGKITAIYSHDAPLAENNWVIISPELI